MEVNKILTYTIILFVGYGIIQFIPTGGIELHIPVAYEDPAIHISFSLSLTAFLDILLAPPFLIIMFYFIHKAISENPSPEGTPISEEKRKIIRFLLFGSGVVLVAGIIMHAVANELNSLSGYPLPPVTPTEIAIYWFDEVLGHKLVYFALIGFLIGLMVVQYWHRSDSQMPKIEVVGLYFWTSVIGIAFGFAVAEGQAGFDMLVICTVLIIVILCYIKFKGLKLRENVFTHFVLVFSAALVITLITWGFVSGFLPGYPFIQQPPFT